MRGLSDRVISRVGDSFPDSTHIKAVGLREARMLTRGDRVAIAPQVLAEFVHVVTEPVVR